MSYKKFLIPFPSFFFNKKIIIHNNIIEDGPGTGQWTRFCCSFIDRNLVISKCRNTFV